jgi:general secretion pathway protein G
METRRTRIAQTGANGFTLIEVLLVVAILGILATVVVVNFAGKQEGAKIKATRASIASIATAVSMYEVELGKFPVSLTDLTVDTESFNAPLDRVPTDSWGNTFQYLAKERGRFEIRSAGPDGAMGSADDITN